MPKVKIEFVIRNDRVDAKIYRQLFQELNGICGVFTVTGGVRKVKRSIRGGPTVSFNFTDNNVSQKFINAYVRFPFPLRRSHKLELRLRIKSHYFRLTVKRLRTKRLPKVALLKQRSKCLAKFVTSMETIRSWSNSNVIHPINC